MQIFLVRHGATDWNLQGRCQGATDLDLNEVGVRQAKQIATSLTNQTIHGIYSSNLKRANRRLSSSVCITNSRAYRTDVRELDHGELKV